MSHLTVRLFYFCLGWSPLIKNQGLLNLSQQFRIQYNSHNFFLSGKINTEKKTVSIFHFDVSSVRFLTKYLRRRMRCRKSMQPFCHSFKFFSWDESLQRQQFRLLIFFYFCLAFHGPAWRSLETVWECFSQGTSVTSCNQHQLHQFFQRGV